ncbi:hypothetical protein O3G_MSEX011116 [Manduca sexta]|uniref:Aminopeptidase N-like N-terminal domain-containing protein n=1 Tax=Manduca sexta TaxID=7130 RepID=A0A921ZJ09_MANSE|nr:hypothetical protein O3G_MSEX011116 [Manduca sexta]
MVREKFKWKLTILLNLLLLNVFTKCLPIETRPASYITTSETAFTSSNAMTLEIPETHVEEVTANNIIPNITHAITFNSLLRNVRPGQDVRQYAIELTLNGNQFTGRAVLDVVITEASMEDNLKFHFDGVTIQSVQTGVFTVASAVPAEFTLDDGILEIEPTQNAATFIVIVEYTGTMGNDGQGLYVGQAYDNPYIAMNLHPTNARRVFPCMDEPTEASTITISFKNIEQTNIVANADLDASNSNDGVSQFRPLQGPPHVWGMIAHDFNNLNIPATNVALIGRPGVPNQDSQGSIAINAYFNYLNTWTEKQYFEIIVNQNSRLHIIALPDVDREWNALSTIGIW